MFISHPFGACLISSFSGLGSQDVEENKIERPCHHRAYISGAGVGHGQ